MKVPTYRMGKVFQDHFFLSLVAIVPAIALFVLSLWAGKDSGIIISYLLMVIPVSYITLLFLRIKGKKITSEVGVLTRGGRSLYYLNSEKRLVTLESFDEYVGKRVRVWYINGFNIILEVLPAPEENKRRRRR